MFKFHSKVARAAIAILLIAPPATAADFNVVVPNPSTFEMNEDGFTARLSDEGCADGFETACTATRQRVEYQSATPHGHGDRVSYSWEVMVDEGLTYNAADKHMYATRFLTADEKTVMQFYLGNDYGYEVNRKTCFGPEAFGKWHQVEVRFVWDSTKKKGLKDKTPGEIHVICDGNEIFSKAGRPNIKAGDVVHLALGLEGALKLAEGDKVSVAFRNIQIGTW